MKRIKIKEILHSNNVGQKICIKGWIKTKRISKNIFFINLNDGSCIDSLQVVIDKTKFSDIILKNINIGGGVVVYGLIVMSNNFQIELNADYINVLGVSDSNNYPIQPKKHSLEFLRDFLHLRLRTNVFGSIARIRHNVSYAIHNFFYKKGFVYINTPIITSTDSEGAGDVFKVTNLDLNKIPKNINGFIDFNKDFFGEEVYLTVSGQLAAESAALSLSDVYTFGPTFRAENSNTKRHLSEFWMIEPEMSFYDINDIVNLSELFLKYIICFVLNNCKEDLLFLSKRLLKNNNFNKNLQLNNCLILRLEKILNINFLKISYTDAFKILKNSKINLKNKFNYPITNWGCDFQKEHECYLVEKYFKKPLIILNYPKSIKSFYMKTNKDKITVSAMDVIFPFIGEIIGGSQREERVDKLLKSISLLNIKKSKIQWYLDTRTFGSVPHSGFGLGLERLLQFITGIDNIRDISLFPRCPNNAKC